MALTHTVLHRILTVVLFHVLLSSLQDKRVGDVLDEVDDGVVVCELFLFYLRGVSSIIRSCNFKLSVITVIYTHLQICIISILVRVEIIIFCTVSIEGIIMSFITFI